MGLNLHYTIIKFFEARMDEHSIVESWRRIANKDEYIYEIKRSRYGDIINIWLCDAYLLTELEYLSRPREIKSGDYILIARPEAGGSGSDLKNKIGIGKIGELMGALNVKKIWTYEPPTEEERSQRAKKKRS